MTLRGEGFSSVGFPLMLIYTKYKDEERGCQRHRFSHWCKQVRNDTPPPRFSGFTNGQISLGISVTSLDPLLLTLQKRHACKSLRKSSEAGRTVANSDPLRQSRCAVSPANMYFEPAFVENLAKFKQNSFSVSTMQKDLQKMSKCTMFRE